MNTNLMKRGKLGIVITSFAIVIAMLILSPSQSPAEVSFGHNVSFYVYTTTADDCVPGDANGDGGVDWADFMFILDHFCAGASVTFTDCADADGDCDIDPWDIFYLIAYMFLSGPNPVPPGCTDPPVTPDPEIPDTIGIAPDGMSVGVGERFSIPIYLSHDEGTGKIVLDDILFDFGGDTDLLICDSVTYWGTRLENSPPLPSRTFTPSFPGSSNEGHVYMSLIAPVIDDSLTPGTGDIANLWFTALAEGVADIDYTHQDSILTIPFPPNGFVDFYNCFQPVIEFGSITIEGAGGLNCDSSFTDPVFVATPAGSHPFVVTLRDDFGEPVVGLADAQVTIINNTGLELCSTQVEFPDLSPVAPSDEDGRLQFYLAAGMCVPTCQAVVTTTCGEIATVPVRCVDSDGDLYVHPIDDMTSDVNCSDFNGNGVIDAADQDIFHLYDWQLCGDPCGAYRLSLSYSPEDSLIVGSVLDYIQVTFENTTAEACSLIDVTFFATCFGYGTVESEIGAYQLDRIVQPGASYTRGIIDFTIPSCGLGCLIAEFHVGDCDDPLRLKICPQIYFECNPEAGTCYSFKTWLTENAYVFTEPPLDLPPGFIIVEEPQEGFHAAGDTLSLEVCHTEVAVIQDSVVYRYYLSDDDQLSPDDDPYQNKVAVRANNGDCTGDCFVDIDDVVFLIEYIFSGGPEPSPLQIGNVDCSDPEPIDIDDVVYLINYIFGDGDPPMLCPWLW
jgi:hypothetical protein